MGALRRDRESAAGVGGWREKGLAGVFFQLGCLSIQGWVFKCLLSLISSRHFFLFSGSSGLP